MSRTLIGKPFARIPFPLETVQMYVDNFARHSRYCLKSFTLQGTVHPGISQSLFRLISCVVRAVQSSCPLLFLLCLFASKVGFPKNFQSLPNFVSQGATTQKSTLLAHSGVILPYNDWISFGLTTQTFQRTFVH